MAEARPRNVGILAAEIYFPHTYVSQDELEDFDGASKGKYTIGLGQERMAFCDDREDINTVFLNAVTRLLENYDIDPNSIGRLEVGTETLIDKSKSAKTVVQRILEEAGNFDVEGVTSINGCYGGTAALFNSVAWVESSAWDGRYAMVVAGDIAVYAEGNARPTGGCGAVALLIGPDAPLALDSFRATHSSDVYDFCKPDLHSEYPIVDGKLSGACYLRALDDVYRRYHTRAGRAGESISKMEDVDYYVFHSPYNKLVRKAAARMAYLDFLADDAADGVETAEELAAFKGSEPSETYYSREVDMAFRAVSSEAFDTRVLPTCHVSRNLGNLYAGSVFGNLLGIVCDVAAELVGKRVAVFSYGSGMMASLYSFAARETDSGEFSLARISSTVKLRERLEARTKIAPADFAAALATRAEAYGVAPVAPKGDVSTIPDGVYYLKSVDDKFNRDYARKGGEEEEAKAAAEDAA
eukprot:PLAT13725.3.p2 GENE.PLAT13725.3~~PLAT13725.3.p2  ORF type:complete len:477 (-),score=235.54 PLAT13725.3:123-1529(-)